MRRAPVTLAGIDPRAIAATFAASDFVTDREHVARSLKRVPFALHLPAVGAWARKRRSAGHVAANLEMLDLAECFAQGIDLTASDDEIILSAEKRARDVRGYLADLGTSAAGVVSSRLERYCRSYGVAPPVTKTLRGLTTRLSCEKWWRRALRRSIVRTLEGHAIRLGFVHRRAALYASHEAVERRAGQRARNRRILEAVEAENDAGERFTLAELSRRNVSNPEVRRAELMTRIGGFEEFAGARGDVAMFYTVTCPSRMHARHWKSGEPVANYDGTTPRGAQAHLCRQWAKARAALKRARAYVYGFRIAEPHHDGTPHWHLLLFMRPAYEAAVTKILRKYAYEKDADELGNDAARRARFDAKAIDTERGTAAGYIAKYVAKNIDGFKVGADFEAGEGAADVGGDAIETVSRVDAWAATWGIRQFQQCGGPGVTIWRELRRLPGPQQLPLFDPLIEHADGGAWASYVRAMGGIEIFKRDRTLQLWRVDYEKENRYGEPAPAAVEGVAHHFIEQCRTRLREWRLIGGGHGDSARGGRHAARPDGRGALGVEGHDGPDGRRLDVMVGRADVGAAMLRGGQSVRGVGRAAVAFDVPWTRVNNCTRVEDLEACARWIADYEGATRGNGPP